MNYLILLIYLFLIIPLCCFSQTPVLQDNFEDGDFLASPAWSGDTEDFTVVEESGNLILKLDAGGAGRSALVLPSPVRYGSWEFFVRFDFSTLSGSNNLKIMLSGDRPEIDDQMNGFVLYAGESGSGDRLELIRYEDGDEAKTILSGTTDINGGGAYRIRVERDPEGVWSLYAAVGSETAPLLEATGIDNSPGGGSWFGFFPEYTSTRADKFFFDDITIAKFPIEVTHAEVSDHTEIRVFFTDPPDPASVQTSDFVISGGVGSPDKTHIEGETVTLVYDTPIPGGDYTLSIQNISDLNGTSVPSGTGISFFLFDRFEPGDVIINEFMYDEPDELAEYIEIRNTSSKQFNLAGWKLGDALRTVPVSNDTLLLPARKLLVLTPDSNALFERFGSRGYIEVESFPTLNNTGDAIRLHTPDGVTADSLTYTPGWGGQETALERRSAAAGSTVPENWSTSPNPLGGTPGRSNEAQPDLQPPEFLELDTVDRSTLRLLFSERIRSENALKRANYEITPRTAIETISMQGDTVWLHLGEALVSGTGYSVRALNLEDLFGNRRASASRRFRYLEFSEPGRGDVVINEFFQGSGSPGFPEFVELYNRSSLYFDLSGWSVGDRTSRATLPDGTLLEASSHLVLTGEESFAGPLANGVHLPGFPTLNNDEDALYIRAGNGTTIDFLSYSPLWNGEPSRSLERRDPAAASGDLSNWARSTSPGGHSAGFQNTVYTPDEIPPSLLFAATLTGNLIEARFNEFIRLTPETRFLLNGVSIPVSSFNPAAGNRILLEAPSGNRAAGLQVDQLVDIKGNRTVSTSVPLAYAMSAGSVVINEIMYDPLADPYDNRTDQSEYIELKNCSDRAVSLEGFFLHDRPDENGNVRPMEPVSTFSRWIPAGGLFIIYADTATSFSDSRIAKYFDLPGSDSLSAIRVDRTGLGLAAAGETVYLADGSGLTIDSVSYNENWHNPDLPDTRGISLERIRPDGHASNPANWGSNTDARGGSPGRENSIYQVSGTGPERNGISFSPNPFSPDGDGYQDRLIINYRLDRPDLLLSVTIFDRYGRTIRRLADGERSGHTGSLIWDGRDDSGNKNRIGIYIILFEAVNYNREQRHTFKEVVVLARRL